MISKILMVSLMIDDYLCTKTFLGSPFWLACSAHSSNPYSQPLRCKILWTKISPTSWYKSPPPQRKQILTKTKTSWNIFRTFEPLFWERENFTHESPRRKIRLPYENRKVVSPLGWGWKLNYFTTLNKKFVSKLQIASKTKGFISIPNKSHLSYKN